MTELSTGRRRPQMCAPAGVDARGPRATLAQGVVHVQGVRANQPLYALYIQMYAGQEILFRWEKY